MPQKHFRIERSEKKGSYLSFSSSDPTTDDAEQHVLTNAGGHHFQDLPVQSPFSESQDQPIGKHSPEAISLLPMQAALEVSQPSDPLEQEADRVARQVARAVSSDTGSTCEDALELSAAKNVTVRERFARKATGDRQQDQDFSAIVASGLKGGGQPLDTGTRNLMERSFGHCFDQVRVYTDDSAGQSAETVAARAYTVGSNIVFKSSEYNPGTDSGRQLLAHELTHVIQQSAAAPSSSAPLDNGMADRQAGIVHRDATGDPKPAAPAPDAAKTPIGPAVHYKFEIKAWIPFASVPDPEEALHDIGFRLNRVESVSDYNSQYRGDGHAGYEGGYRVFHVAEFDWDGVKISNVTFPAVAHFGTSHRDFSATLTDSFSFPTTNTFFKDTESATTNSAVTGLAVGPQEVDLGMSSPNPLTIGPAPDIDADYSFFISQDTLGIETVTVRWTTDFMPNHGYRVTRAGTVIKEHVVNALPGPVNGLEIFLRLNSKSNGGADRIEPGNPSGG
jgi:hypothetical protein